MSTYSSKKGDIIEKNRKYFDFKYSDREDFYELRKKLEKVCKLIVKKESSKYKIDFLNKRGKSIHSSYIYPTKQVFIRKFGIDPDEVIKGQKNSTNSIKPIQTKQTRKTTKIVLNDKAEEKVANVVEVDPKEREIASNGREKDKSVNVVKSYSEKRKADNKSETKGENTTSTQDRDKKKEEVLSKKSDSQLKKIEPKKEGFIKRTLNKWKAEREANKRREEKENRNLRLALYGMIGTLVLGNYGWNFYLNYTDEPLVFPEIEDGSLDYYNTDSSQTSDQTQFDNQTQATDTNNTTPTTIEGKPFTGDLSDFFNENMVIISHSRMNGIKHLLPKSIKEENYHAVDGASTAKGIEWMKAASENTTITRVYISMGINDLVKSDMDKLIEEAHKKFPNAIIYVQEEYMANRFDEDRRNLLKEFNEHSKELCSGLDYAYYIEITNNKHNLAHENGDIIGEEDEVYGNKEAAIHIVKPKQQEKLTENMNEGIHDNEEEIYLQNHQGTSKDSTTEQSTENTETDTQNSNGNIYYVSKEDSTDERTSKTISEAVEKAQPGDTVIVKKGTYNEKVKIRDKQDITIKAEGEVIIDGKDLSGSLFSIKNSKNIYVQGFAFAHMLADSSQGVKVYGDNTSDITIDNCTFKDIRCVHEKAPEKGSNAIYVVGSSTTPIDNIVIKNCKCEDIAAGYSEVISFEGNITNYLIENVMITSNNVKSNIGICICGNQGTCKDKKLDRPRNGTIRYCNVSKCESPYDPDSAYGIYVDGGEDILIENNTVSLCEGGIEVGAEIASSAYSGAKNGETENITVKNNYILNCLYGVQIGGFEDKRGTVYKVIFEGNELQNCGSKDSEMLTLTKCNNVIIKNNKFISDEEGKLRVINIKMPEKLCYDIDFEKNEFKFNDKILKPNNFKCFEYKGGYYTLNNFYKAIEHISKSQER